MKRFIFYLVILTVWSLYFFFDIHKTYAAEEKNSYYVGAYGGWLKLQDVRMEYYDYTNWNKVGKRLYEFGAGYRLGAFVGKRINRYFRAELEYSYMRGKEESMVDEWPGYSDMVNLHHVGTQTMHVALINGYFDFDFQELREYTNAIPYIGVGFGGMQISYRGRHSKNLYSGIYSTRAEQYSYAGQLAAGINYDMPGDKEAGIEPGDITVGLNYKCLRMFSEQLETTVTDGTAKGNALYNFKRKPVTSHFVGVSVAYNFN